MNFDARLFPTGEYIKNIEKYIGHIKEDNKEKLEDHMKLVLRYFEQICKEKNLFPILKKFWQGSEKGYEYWKDMLINVPYMHDIGKVNIVFQYEKMKNKIFDVEMDIQDATHSKFSAAIYMIYFSNKLKEIMELYTSEGMNKDRDNELSRLFLYMYINAYIISRHHIGLENFNLQFEDLIENIKDEKWQIKLKNHCEDFDFSKLDMKLCSSLVDKINYSYIRDKVYKKWEILELYIYSRLVYGLLVSADFYATYEFMTGNSIDDFGVIKDVDDLIEKFENNKIVQNIRKYDIDNNIFAQNNINKYRSEIFLEAERNIKLKNNENIFFLEAPTGSGKTITSINIALNLLKENKNLNNIFYIFPFNTLVEQTSNSLYQFFDKKDIGIINSITPMDNVIKTDKNKIIKVSGAEKEENLDYENIDYEATLLKRQFLHYPIIVTTHVHSFRDLFGTERGANFVISHLANSVVILDEIQSYKSTIWKEIIIFLKKYAQLLNIKIVIMSATLPNLSVLLEDSDTNICNLISNREKYFNNPIFKNRVNIDYELMSYSNNFKSDREIFLTILEEKVISYYKNGKKVVVEFIFKKSASKFYQLLADNLEVDLEDLFLITGDDNKVERERIINLTREKSKMILVATQVIEAGVDIDMDIGFKDNSLLDLDEQFLGRVNRSCKKSDSKVYFFNLDDSKKIYKDIRSKSIYTLLNMGMQHILSEKSFQEYYKKILNDLEKESVKNNDNNLKQFLEKYVVNLNYKEIKNRLELINNDYESVLVFFPRKLYYKGIEYDGNEIWFKFKELVYNKKMNYAEKMVRLADILEKVNLFGYNIPKKYIFGISYSDKIGDSILKIDNWEQYFINNKFDRDTLVADNSIDFIV